LGHKKKDAYSILFLFVLLN